MKFEGALPSLAHNGQYIIEQEALDNINLFSALSNGKYKSCIHRAVVNRDKERRSLTFFLSPKDDTVVRPPQELIVREGPRKYPDFKWSELLEFTQKHYRPNNDTLQSFVEWRLSS